MIVHDEVTEFGETETYRRAQGLAPSVTTHTHAWSDSSRREHAHLHPGGDVPHRYADHAETGAPRIPEEWWPATTDPQSSEHVHVLTNGEQRRHAHAGGSVVHLWESHTEDELAVGAAVEPEQASTDPLVEARAWLDEHVRSGGEELFPGGSLAWQAAGHLDSVVGYVDDALATMLLGGGVAPEAPEPTVEAPDRLELCRETGEPVYRSEPGGPLHCSRHLFGNSCATATYVRDETAPRRHVQLRVVYSDQTTLYFPIPEGQGWRIDGGLRLLVIGRGLGREEIPLDRVLHFSPEEVR